MTQLERYVELTEYANKLATERDDLAAQLSAAHIQCGHNQLTINALGDRVRELEAALRKYGIHINDCPKNLLQPECDLHQRCTCGFEQETPVNPTMQHAPDCPILHGKECLCDPYPITSDRGGKP